MFSCSGIMSQADNMEIKGMQSRIRQVFEAMENFTRCTLKAYEKLNGSAQGKKMATDNAKHSKSYIGLLG